MPQTRLSGTGSRKGAHLARRRADNRISALRATQYTCAPRRGADTCPQPRLPSAGEAGRGLRANSRRDRPADRGVAKRQDLITFASTKQSLRKPSTDKATSFEKLLRYAPLHHKVPCRPPTKTHPVNTPRAGKQAYLHRASGTRYGSCQLVRPTLILYRPGESGAKSCVIDLLVLGTPVRVRGGRGQPWKR